MMSIILRTLVDTIRQFFVRHAKYLILDEICAYKIRRRLVVRGALTNFQRNTIKNTARFFMHTVWKSRKFTITEKYFVKSFLRFVKRYVFSRNFCLKSIGVDFQTESCYLLINAVLPTQSAEI